MANILIKEQSLPQRCEICHQQDYFDAVNNYCARCAEVIAQMPDLNAIDNQASVYRSHDFFLRLSSSGDRLTLRFTCSALLLLCSLQIYVGLFSEYGSWPDRYGIVSFVYFTSATLLLPLICSSIVPIKLVKIILSFLVSYLAVILFLALLLL